MSKRIIALLLSAVLVLTACGGSADENPGSGDGSSTASGWEDTVNIALSNSLTQLNPIDTWNGATGSMYMCVFDPLTDYNYETNEVTMRLAESIEWVGDGNNQLAIKIKDAKFSTGLPVTSEDVKYSLETAKYSSLKSYLDRIEIVNDKELVVYLSQPCSFFKQTLSYSFASIVSKADAEQGRFVGSSAWAFDEESFIVGSSVTCYPNEYYWGEKSETKQLNFTVITDASTRLVALQTGEIDFNYGVNNNEIANAQADPSLDVILNTGQGFQYIAFNNRKEEVISENELNFRRAVSCAIDKNTLLLGSSELEGKEMVSMWDHSDPAYITDESEFALDLTYNPDEALKYLEKTDIRDLTVTLNSSQTANKIIAQIIQEQLRQVGITMTIDEIDPAGMSALTKWDANGDYDALVYSNSFYGLPAIGFNYFKVGSGVNKSYIVNARVQELLAIASNAANSDEYNNSMKEVQQIIHDEASYIPLFWQTACYATTEGTQGYRQLIANVFDWRFIQKAI